jgi:archaemetzincin
VLLTLLFSCENSHSVKQKLKGEELIAEIKKNDKKLPDPKYGDWLYMHNELGQTFRKYKASHPVKPDSLRNKIYIQPIGLFSPAQKNVINYTAEYLEKYFSLKTIVTEEWPDYVIPKTARRANYIANEQLLAPFILDSLLVKRIPVDALVIMAITEKDLYPEESWNYVFGLASYKKRVGVSSVYRLSDLPVTSKNYQQCLERLIKTSSHEIGHMLGLAHCIDAVCVMNGSNNLAETDSRPNRLCSNCVSKLYWNLNFDNRSRLKSLSAFFHQHELEKDLKVLNKDLASLGEAPFLLQSSEAK